MTKTEKLVSTIAGAIAAAAFVVAAGTTGLASTIATAVAVAAATVAGNGVPSVFSKKS